MAGTAALLIHTAIAVALVVGLIVFARINPVISLVIGALYLGIAAGLGAEGTTTAVAEGFGNLMAEVGLIIGFGVMLGALLSAMGTLHRIVEGMLRLFGANRSPHVLGLSSGIIFPAIYFDVALVISSFSSPVLRAPSGRSSPRPASGTSWPASSAPTRPSRSC